MEVQQSTTHSDWTSSGAELHARAHLRVQRQQPPALLITVTLYLNPARTLAHLRVQRQLPPDLVGVQQAGRIAGRVFCGFM